MASLVLHKNDYEVTLYEMRHEYTRSIQWTVRQSFIDYLYSIDKGIAEEIFKLVSATTNGYRFLSDKSQRYPDGAYKHISRDQPLPGDRVKTEKELQLDKLTQDCGKSLDVTPVGIVRAKLLEARFLELLVANKVANVEIAESPDCVANKIGGYDLKVDGPDHPPTAYDLIVICEGAHTTTRKKVGIKSIPLSRKRAQVSGDVKLERQGMVIQYQHAKVKGGIPNLPSGELLYSTLLSTDGKETTCWVVGDVSSDALKKIDESPESARKKLVKNELETIAARTMLETDDHVVKAGVDGVVVGKDVSMFTLQAKKSSAASAGNNVVLVGDAVGEGHPAVGGGMHVAGLCHQKRLEKLAKEWHTVGSRTDALSTYDEGALDDTMAWIWRSIEYYYLSIPKDVVKAVLAEILEDRKKRSSIKVPEAMEERIISVYFGPRDAVDPELAGFKDTV
jgi:2-polyprenyl-6-methoxyphenol hydroxylase-like FAD-dependent oxidoreductase